MILDIEMLRSFYASYSESVAQAKATVKRPLTYAEKVLFAHLFDPTQLRPYKRGVEYVDFRPNRVAMQDATAQMALLQFMNAIFSTRICITSNYLFAKIQLFLQLVALFIKNLSFCYYFSLFLINLLHIYAIFINKLLLSNKF